MEGVFPIKGRIVYIVNLGGYDRVIENHYPNPGWKWYLVTDSDIESDFYNIIKLPKTDNPKRESRRYKWLPHLLFDCEYSLYIDGNVRVLTDLDGLVDKYLEGYDMAAYKHRCRDCLYDEGIICKYFGLDDAEVIDKQLNRYKKDDYPAHNGMTEGNTLLRRHTGQIKRLGQFEWEQIQNGSYRDQLSFNYSAWKLGVKVNTFKGMIKLYPEAKQVLENYYNIKIEYNSPYFEMEKHFED